MGTFCLTGLGLTYGLLLTVFGLGVANGGDGFMAPLYVFGTPSFIPLLLAPSKRLERSYHELASTLLEEK